MELDFESKSAYIRFSKKKIARTVPHHGPDGMFTAVDLDKQGEVVGIEAVGFNVFTIDKLIHAARVDTSRVDFSRASIRPSPHLAAAS